MIPLTQGTQGDSASSKVNLLHQIEAGKRKYYTLVTLAFLTMVVLVTVVFAFISGLVLRQVINTAVLAILLICLATLYKSDKLLEWPTYVAVLVLHVIATSGFITNGGILSYAVVVIPLLPLVSLLLLHKAAARLSFIYSLLICTLSFIATLSGMHPANMTPPDLVPYLAMIFAALISSVSYICFRSLLVATELAQQRANEYLDQLTEEVARRDLAERKLVSSMQAKTEFLSAISHELKTPLNAIKGFGNLLAREPMSARGLDCVSRVNRSSDELLAKINNLLEYTNASSGTDIQYKSFVLDELLSEIENEYAALGQIEGTQGAFEYAQVRDYIIHYDFAKLRKILKCLLDNAYKFAKGGTVKLTVERGTLAGIEALICQISDDGPGLDENIRRKLFQAFTQLDMSTSRAFEGMGLGLAISLKYTQLLGGKLAVDNHANQGCSFTLTLPMTFQQARQQAPQNWVI
ncbi:MAG: HAMP domain-containing histidine kinase [Hahellaceae bacterium]|nr:HAMP domain-containing histidine kinase [Hahellaceae bacterium]